MALSFAGNGTITGLSVGGLPDGCIQAADLASGVGVGGVLQVKYAETTAPFTTTSSTLVAITGMSVTITPTSSSSKILVIAQVGAFGGVGTGYSQLQLMRDSTAIHLGDASGSRERASVIERSGSNDDCSHPTIIDLDDPSSTSAITYTLHGKCEASNKFHFNAYHGDSDHAIQGARAASGMMAIEIASSVL